MWKCNCGAECGDNSNFCSKCGSARPKTDDSILWYCIVDGERKGPLTLETILKMISEESIIPDTLVWHNGLHDWIPARYSELNQFLTKIPPPLQNNQISNKWAWTLATVPICTNILLACLGMTEPLLSICVIVLNCIFSGMDLAYLKRSGIRTGGWLYLGFFVVPIYLFVRASKTNKKYAYAIVWCGLFILSILPIW